jgi:hypothetical protein
LFQAAGTPENEAAKDMKSFEDMTEPELREACTRIARAAEAQLPPGPGPRGKALFVLLIFDDPKVAQYVSNAQRSDIIKSMRECADRLERKEDVTR